MQITRAKPSIVESDIFNAEEGIGLIESLNWYVVPGIFKNNKIDAAGMTKAVSYKDFVEEPKIGTIIDFEGIKAMYKGNGSSEVLYSSDTDEETDYKLYLINTDANKHVYKMKSVSKLFYFPKSFFDQLYKVLINKESDLLFVNDFLTSLQLNGIRRMLIKKCEDDKSLDQNGEANVVVVDRLGVILQIFNKRSNNQLARLQTALIYLQYSRMLYKGQADNINSLSQLLHFDILKQQMMPVLSKNEKIGGKKDQQTTEGESKTENHKRVVKELELTIKQKIEEMKKQKSKLAKNSSDNKLNVTVAIIGYTNSGKSALLNCFAKKKVAESKNMLFQTLETITRKVHVRGNFEVNLIDTIGFISNLPYELVPPFLSTIEHVRHADIILHIRDISHPNTEGQKEGVESVAKQVKIDNLFDPDRVIEVRNKADLYLLKNPNLSIDDLENTQNTVYISATTKLNLDQLKKMIQNKVYKLFNCYEKQFRVSVEDYGKIEKWFKENAGISDLYDINYGYEWSSQFPNGYVDFACVVNNKIDESYKKRFEGEYQPKKDTSTIKEYL